MVIHQGERADDPIQSHEQINARAGELGGHK